FCLQPELINQSEPDAGRGLGYKTVLRIHGDRLHRQHRGRYEQYVIPLPSVRMDRPEIGSYHRVAVLRVAEKCWPGTERSCIEDRRIQHTGHWRNSADYSAGSIKKIASPWKDGG